MKLQLNLFLSLLRVKQWIKNLFLYPPLFFSHQFFHVSSFISVTIGVLSFSFISSAIYIFNDIQDLKSDRLHLKKKHRPIASGKISIFNAIIVMIMCLVISFLLAVLFALPYKFIWTIITYCIINLFYSIYLKHIPIIEMLIVSSGFVLRLFAGSVIVNESLTVWIIYCTWLLSLMLIVGKRRGDIYQGNDLQNKRRSLAYYNTHFLDLVLAILTASTFICYMMFCVSNYASQHFGAYIEFTVPFVLIGLLRFMQIIVIGKGGDDPTALIYKDRPLQFSICGWLITFFIIIYIK